MKDIKGIKSGYRELYSLELLGMCLMLVHNWHKRGGTFVKFSRGGFNMKNKVDVSKIMGLTIFILWVGMGP